MKTIFFIKSTVPTKEELSFADSIKGKVVFRNVNFLPHDISEGSIERCDAICGQVPKVYSDRFNVIDFKPESEPEPEPEPEKSVKGSVAKWKPNNK